MGKNKKKKTQQKLNFTEDEIMLLKKFANSLQSESHVEQNFQDFKGILKGTTIQLHEEVWIALDAFCEDSKISKKTVVNEAIWAYLKSK